MRRFRFFSPEKFSADTEIELSPEQSHHAAAVLRLVAGDAIEIANGQGLLAQALLVQISKKSARAKIQSVETHPCPFRVSLCFGIAKGKALDFIIHKSAEIGIRSLQPLETKYSLKKSEWNADRWHRVLEEGIKQNQSLFIPELKAPLTLGEWARKRNPETLLFFCDEEVRSSPPLTTFGQASTELLVGSEGGFSDEERAQIHALSPRALSLGSNRLRAETATLVACVLAKKALGEL